MSEPFISTVKIILITFLTGESPLEVEEETQAEEGDEVAGGDERPLDHKLPHKIEVKLPSRPTIRLIEAKEIHRLVLEDFDQLERRSEEISGPIANATCSAHVHGLPYYFHEITPLWLACYFNVWDSALLLLRRGSDPNKAVRRDTDGRGYVRTPLYWAAVSGATVVCRSLLANGARQDIDTGA